MYPTEMLVGRISGTINEVRLRNSISSLKSSVTQGTEGSDWDLIEWQTPIWMLVTMKH